MLKSIGLAATIVACLMLLLGAGVALAGSSPAEVVRALYPDGLPQDEAGLAKLLTADLAAAILAAQSPAAIETNGLVLDFDPVTDSQDPAVTDVAVEPVSEAGGKATVKARFKDSGQLKELTYELVAAGDIWRIRNITRAETSDGGWDLRLILGLQ